MNLHTSHQRELLDSRIDADIAALNFISLKGDTAYSYLIPNITQASGRSHPDAQWRWARMRYSHIEAGGWWCSGFNPTKGYRIGRKTPIQLLNLLLQVNAILALLFIREYSSPIPTEWGCFKPDTPRSDYKDPRKIIKYEHPPKMPTQLFCLDISPKIWRKICDRYGMTMPEVEKAEKENSCGVQFWDWVMDNFFLPIILTEGAKKAAALLSAGYIAIALPGINSGYRTPKDDLSKNRHIIEHLEVFTTDQRPIYFAFDQDLKYKTRINCRKAIETTASLLEREHNCVTHILTWTGAKGVDDYLAISGERAFKGVYDSAVKFLEWKLVNLSQLNYLSKEINVERLNNIDIPKLEKIIGIKSPKGTGKTHWLVNIVAKAHENLQRVLILTHRVQLGQALAERFGIPYVTEIRDKEGTGELLGYALCVDSLHAKSKARFNPNDWRNAIVIIDEAEQVLWHTLNANTEVSKHRVTVLRNLQTLITSVLDSEEGKIYLADADLTDISLNWVKSFAPYPIQPYVIVNRYQPKSGKALIYSGRNPSGLVMEIQKQVEAGKKVFVCCTGQKINSVWGTTVLERKLRAKYPGIRILRIDSESVADPSHPAFGCMFRLNEILLDYDVILASPSIETGVSIDIKGHFDAVFGIFQGVSPDTSVRQALARVRETVDRHIWIAPTGLGFARIGNGAINPFSLIASENKQTKAHSLLMSSISCADASFQISQQEVTSNFQSPSLYAWGARGAIINAGFIHYKDTVIRGLVEDGYTIEEVVEIEDSRHIIDEVKAIRDQGYLEEREAIANAPECSEIEYLKLKDKRAKTREERYQQRKMELKEKYCVDITPELIRDDDEGWYQKLRIHYFLTVGEQFLYAREKQLVLRQVQSGEGNIWKPDFNKKALLAVIKLMQELNIVQLLNKDKVWKDGDDVVESIASKAIENRFIIKDYLGITISDKNSAMRIVQKLLEKIGIRLKFTGEKEGSRGQQKRKYKYIPPTDSRSEIFTKWVERDEERYNISVVTTCNMAA